MNKGLIVLLVVLALGCGAFYATRGPAADDRLKVVDAAPAATVKVTCRYCGTVFSLDQARPAGENRMLLVCPHCGKPTPRAVMRNGR